VCGWRRGGGCVIFGEVISALGGGWQRGRRGERGGGGVWGGGVRCYWWVRVCVRESVSERQCARVCVCGKERERERETCGWVMSHIIMSHVTHTNESYRTYVWVMSHIWMSRFTCVIESGHTWMSHVTHMNESHHTYEWAMSHIWMSHVTHVNESCYGVATMSRLIKITGSILQNIIPFRGLFCKRALLKRLYSAKETYNFKEPTNRSHPIHTFVSHVIDMNESCLTYECVTSHTWTSHVTHMNGSCCTYKWVMSNI